MQELQAGLLPIKNSVQELWKRYEDGTPEAQRGGVFLHSHPGSSRKLRDNAPYTIAIVKTPEGPLVEGHIVETDKEVKIGTKVRMVFRKMHADADQGIITYHFKFEVI